MQTRKIPEAELPGLAGPVKPADYDEAMTFDWSQARTLVKQTLHRSSPHAALWEERYYPADPFEKPWRIKRRPDGKLMGAYTNKEDALNAYDKWHRFGIHD